jgi:pimeloyl-ACP methyl ester carboxylesterase
MTRGFYSSAIFFTSLYIIITFFRSIIYFQLEERMGELQSVTGWFVFEFLISLIWLFILLTYFHYKQYWVTFWVMTVYIAASLFQFIFSYSFLTTKEVPANYFMATLYVLGTGILYGISLIFSEAGKRPWLKAAGVFLFLLELAMMSTCIWAISSHDVLLNGTAAKIEQWASLVASLVPALFIMNFRREREAAENVNTSRQETLNGVMNFVAVVALVSTLIFGFKLVSESMWLSDNPDHVSEHLKKSAQSFEARTYVNSQGDTMRYRLLKPLDYDSTKKYPLVVCLHGSSGCGTDNVKQVAASLPAQLLSDHENRIKYPAFLFVPQCPPKTGWGGILNLPAVDALVLETMQALEKELPIDENRRYVAGNSLGGYGAWHLICKRPEMFAAAIPISGGGNSVLAQNIVDVPVWAFHGAKDRNVPVSGSRNIIQAIKNAGGDPRYTEYPDEAHDIWKKVTGTPDLLDWLFAQERDKKDR